LSVYCDIAPGHALHGPYHDLEYGFPLSDDDALFERLCLEIFQAGLSWLIVLKKRDALRAAFDGFSVTRVATYDETKILALLADQSIVRHRGKINAVIENARRVLLIQRQSGSFAGWLAQQTAKDKTAWTKLFKQTFIFTGGEIVNEFLMSIGLLPGAHRPDCPVALRLAAHTAQRTSPECTKPPLSPGGGL
jgi:DNA-3-methyladenine glycosylase I